MSRDTTTGKFTEKLVSEQLTKLGIPHRGGANFGADVNGMGVKIGLKQNGGRHFVDIVAGNDTADIDNPSALWSLKNTTAKTLVSIKNQDVAGTAEEKIPHEMFVLQNAVEKYLYKRAVIVLNGDGWKWKEYFLSDPFKNKMKVICPDVDIIRFEDLGNYTF